MKRPIPTYAAIPVLAIGLGLTSCSNMNETQQSTLSGGAIGAATGAVGTAITGGCVSCGAAIGGAVGAGAGYVIEKTDGDENDDDAGDLFE